MTEYNPDGSIHSCADHPSCMGFWRGLWWTVKDLNRRRMRMVKLYDPELDEIEMYETTSGRWVKKSDYAALKAENEKLRDRASLLVSAAQGMPVSHDALCQVTLDKAIAEVQQALNNEEQEGEEQEEK